MNKEVNIDLSKCDDVICKCGNGLFIQAFTLKRIPGLLIAQNQDKIVNVAQMVCSSCGEMFVPDVKPKNSRNK